MSAKLAGARCSLAFRGHCRAQAVPVRFVYVRLVVDSLTGSESARVVYFFSSLYQLFHNPSTTWREYNFSRSRCVT
jgi:hypothetical protein